MHHSTCKAATTLNSKGFWMKLIFIIYINNYCYAIENEIKEILGFFATTFKTQTVRFNLATTDFTHVLTDRKIILKEK